MFLVSKLNKETRQWELLSLNLDPLGYIRDVLETGKYSKVMYSEIIGEYCEGDEKNNKLWIKKKG